MGSKKYQALVYATLAAVFYAINIPVSKLLLHEVGPTIMAASLYLGAGIGVGILALGHEHTFVHTHDGTTHAHTVSHSHRHNHYLNEDKHAHHHDFAELEKLAGARHV